VLGDQLRPAGAEPVGELDGPPVAAAVPAGWPDRKGRAECCAAA